MSSNSSGDLGWTLGALPDDDESDMAVREIGRASERVEMESTAPRLIPTPRLEKPALSPSKPALTPTLKKEKQTPPKLSKTVKEPLTDPSESDLFPIPPVIDELPEIPKLVPSVPKLEKIPPSSPEPEIPKLTKIEKPKPPVIKLYNNLENMYFVAGHLEDMDELVIISTLSETSIQNV